MAGVPPIDLQGNRTIVRIPGDVEVTAVRPVEKRRKKALGSGEAIMGCGADKCLRQKRPSPLDANSTFDCRFGPQMNLPSGFGEAPDDTSSVRWLESHRNITSWPSIVPSSP